MQTRELDHATIAVANTTDISGTATADKIKRGLRSEKKRSQWRISGLPGLGSLMVTGIFVALTLLPARAGQGGVPAEIAALQAQVTALQSQVNSLQTQLAAVQSNKALALGPFVTVVSGPGKIDGVNGPHIYFTGANIHIVSGSGFTDDGGNPRGLGNLIIGYDEDPKNYVDRSPLPEGTLPLGPLSQGDRGGSHNLVIGAANRFTQAAFGGLVVGTANTIESYGASISGGAANTASGYGASVSGGLSNTAEGPFASVSGGRFNSASQFFTSVSGGESNTATGVGGSRFNGHGSSVSGGQSNIAAGTCASVSGGSGNTAFDEDTSITGGGNNTAGSDITFQGGLGATVVGGTGNTAGGHFTVIIGGKNIRDDIDSTIQPKAPFP